MLGRFCEVHLIQDYLDSTRHLAKIFRNFSPNSSDYELFCLERWFILRDFCLKNKVERVVHLDSDVMVYSDLHEAGKAFAGTDMVRTGFQMPASMFINSIAALGDFCDFMVSQYENNISTLEAGYQEWLSKGLTGGISDMHFLHEFVARGKWTFGDNSAVTNASRFDHSANMDEGYEFDGDIKKFQFRGGQPYGTKRDTGESIRFHTIHFQGMSKKHIPAASTRRDMYYYWFSVMNRLA